jgi:hypothetical protein
VGKFNASSIDTSVEGSVSMHGEPPKNRGGQCFLNYLKHGIF